MILRLPSGYDTPLGEYALSGGQKQQIALARAFYRRPRLIILDEPTQMLDAAGTDSMNAALRDLKASGSTIVLATHRPGAIRECDQLLMLDNGANVAFGPTKEVLERMVQNHEQIMGEKRAGTDQLELVWSRDAQ